MASSGLSLESSLVIQWWLIVARCSSEFLPDAISSGPFSVQKHDHIPRPQESRAQRGHEGLAVVLWASECRSLDSALALSGCWSSTSSFGSVDPALPLFLSSGLLSVGGRHFHTSLDVLGGSWTCS